jgi:tRNA A37 threonylcarbamoyladenosine dehydratase
VIQSDLDRPDLERPDLERRFGGLRRLHGDAAYERLRGLRLAVVGLGGVGSWAAEALARSGVAALTLIDLDHVSESNVNRQVQALGRTLGQAKAQALAERIADIHPGCEVVTVEDFVSAENWPALLNTPGREASHRLDGLIDACDQVRAKVTLAAWAAAQRMPFVTVGAAGGKRMPQRVQVEDLATVTHDPLLAGLRQRLRKEHSAPRSGPLGVDCVFSREQVLRPAPPPDAACGVSGDLSCHGYGSTVTVTATFGLVAASVLMERALSAKGGRASTSEAREAGRP